MCIPHSNILALMRIIQSLFVSLMLTVWRVCFLFQGETGASGPPGTPGEQGDVVSAQPNLVSQPLFVCVCVCVYMCVCVHVCVSLSQCSVSLSHYVCVYVFFSSVH